MNQLHIGDIGYGLWIGNIHSIIELLKRPLYEEWTIISIIDSKLLLSYCQTCINQIQKSIVENNETTSTTTSKQHCNIVKHIKWQLKDEPSSNILSPILISILRAIDESILQDNRNNTNNYNDDERLITTTTVSITKPPTNLNANDTIDVVNDISITTPIIKNCLIHCVKGQSRSVTVCAAWLLSRKKFHTMKNALDHIRSCRPSIQPNIGFISYLHAIEQCNGNINDAIDRIHYKKKYNKINTKNK